MRVIKQLTYETCLPCCLLMMAGKTQKDEIEIWKHGWKFNYLIGQLNFVSKKYGKEIEAYIENKYYFSDLQKQATKNVKLINKKINFKLVIELLRDGPVVVYVDGYYPYKVGYVHAPHFWMALSSGKNFIEIADPWDGEVKKIPTKIFNKAISSLRDHLKYSPVLIIFPQVKKNA